MMWMEILVVVVLVLAIIPFFLLGSAFKDPKKGQPGGADGGSAVLEAGDARKPHAQDPDAPGDSGDSGSDGGGDGGGGGGK
jgi:ABC-type Na+ efflux pump permease subunit